MNLRDSRIELRSEPRSEEGELRLKDRGSPLVKDLTKTKN
jgi:hypothetical protein